jgi:hypothetical protein
VKHFGGAQRKELMFLLRHLLDSDRISTKRSFAAFATSLLFLVADSVHSFLAARDREAELYPIVQHLDTP